MKTTKELRLAVSGALLAVLTACASGYTQFYTPAPGVTPDAIARIWVAPPPAEPQLERSAPTKAEIILDAYARRGYAMIGYSMFNSGMPESEASAVKQGQKVGADLVLVLNPQYTGTITSSVPITTPTTSTSYTSGSATAYGPGGTVTAYGSATTTTYGSQTTYIPMSVHRSDYGAVYFVKQRFNLGAFARDLDDQERQRLQRNRGAVVTTVVDDTPAFFADILPGDVLISIGGQELNGWEHFGQVTQSLAGQEVEVILVRGDQRITKRVQLLK